MSRGFLEEGLPEGWSRSQPSKEGGKGGGGGGVPEVACAKALRYKEAQALSEP